MAAAVVLALLPAGDAVAWTNDYCGVLIHSWSWCGDGSDHTYDSNRATYNGSGSVWVCERLINSSTRTVRTGWGCAYNYKYTYYGTTNVTLFEAEVTHDSGSARHTIHGQAIA